MLTSNNLKVSEHIEVSIGHPIHGAPAKLVVGDDEAFVIGFGARGSANGGVAAFTSSNCAEIWRYMIDAAVEGPCACDTTGRVIFGDYNGCLHILNTPSLEKRTSQTLGSPILNPPLLLDEANVIVAASNGVIATIDPRTGRIIRTAQANVRITSELIIGPRGKIISTTATGSILQFDPINGILTTIHDHKLLLYVAPVFIDDTTTVLADSRGSVSAISIAGSNPATPIWQFHAKGGIRYSPTLKDGKLFLAAQDHYLYALDARTGKEMWRYEMYGGATTRPLVLRGLVIVADNRAHIYAIDDETGKLVWLEMAGKRIKNADDPSVLESPQVFGGFALVGQQLIFGTYSGIVCSWPYPMNQWEHVATRAARDKRYDDAINTWLSSGQTDARMRAAKLMNEHSQFLRAAALFIQAGHRLEAAQSYEEAARLALSSDLWLEAANLWRDLKELEQSRRIRRCGRRQDGRHSRTHQ